ncbi:MAG TPA: hypothetical protein VGN19_14500, partial [Pedococcus sp.]|nr:hypothetical protein [Pedococcus sp.]
MPNRLAVEGRLAVGGQDAVEGPLAAVPPLAVLAVVAWCVATRGGTGPFDLALACAALGVALVLAARNAPGPQLRAPRRTALLFLALQAWL